MHNEEIDMDNEKGITISYSILCHNEDTHLQKLLQFLVQYKDKDDEIVVLDDYSDNEKTKQILHHFHTTDQIKLYQRHLNRNFSSQRNYLNDISTGNYGFRIDADEIPTKWLIKNIKSILHTNPDIDIFLLPKINIIHGQTEKYKNLIKREINSEGWINWPNYMQTIWKNVPWIYWINPVHERLVGNDNHMLLPKEKKYSIYHEKHMSRFLIASKLYTSITLEHHEELYTQRNIEKYEELFEMEMTDG